MMVTEQLELRKEQQLNPIAGEVSALIAVTRPIILGVLASLKSDIVEEAGGFDQIKLKMLPRLRREGDGDCGICYEYAVHDAIKRNDSTIRDRISTAIKKCRVPGKDLESILFGAEKSGTKQIIDTAKNILTDESRLLTGKQSQPPKLKNYLSTLAAAFRRESTRLSLPTSINGLWKADLFLGCTDSDRWIGTTVKINPRQLEAANGLRVGIVPASQVKSDKIVFDDSKNLVICPLPYDGSFMEIFYSAWGIVQQFLHADAQIPKEAALPLPDHRRVAHELASRREFPVVEVIEALKPLAQPHLLKTTEQKKSLILPSTQHATTATMIAPISRVP